MLLWHDSLDYRSTTYLQARYTAAAGFTVGAPHPQQGRTSIQATSGTLTLSVTAGGDTAIVGFLFSATSLLFAADFLYLRSPGGTIQTRVRLRPSGSGGVFEFRTGDGNSLLHESSVIDLTTARYLEFVIKVATTGSVSLRVDGLEDTRADFVDTEFLGGVGWGQVTLIPANGCIDARIADLYVQDNTVGTFKKHAKPLGRVIGSKMFPGVAEGIPSWSILPTGKHRLILIIGQSNNNGRGGDVFGPWRSPNNKVLIWDNLGAPTFRPLEAQLNTFGYFLTPPRPQYWGPEMMMAERIAAWFEGAGETAVPNVRMFKMCQDSSTLAEFPGSPDFSWFPDQAGSLYQRMLADLNTAVTALGGWSNVEQVDLFMFQGETEALFSPGPAAYAALNTAFFLRIDTDIPVPVNFTRVLIHHKLDRGLFTYTDGVRIAQTNPSIPGRLIHIDESALQDGAHLTPQGYDALGEKYFQVWLENQKPADLVKDYYYVNTVDSLHISGTSGSDISFKKVPELQGNLTQSPVLAVSVRTHLESLVSTPLQISVGPAVLPDTDVTGSQWTPWRMQVDGIYFPEAVADGSIVLSIA